MSLLDTLRKSLTPEQLTMVQDALGDDFNYDVVPRSRLNKVIQQRDEARRLANGSPASGQSDPDSDPDPAPGAPAGKSAGAFTQQDIDAAVEAERQKGQEAMADLRRRIAVTEKLREAKFVDPELVLSAGLIDLTKVTVDDKFNVTGGLDDQIEAVKTNKPYLIDSSSAGRRGTGKEGGTDPFASITNLEEFMKLSTDKQIEFKTAYPDVFKGFMKQLVY